MIASAAQVLAGDELKAGVWAADVRSRNPRLDREDFFRAFPMKSAVMRMRISIALQKLGFQLPRDCRCPFRPCQADGPCGTVPGQGTIPAV